MLFTREEKNMLIGAFTTGIVDASLESYYNYLDGQLYDIRAHPENPLYWLYYSINDFLPPVDDLIALVGVPVLMWGIGKKKRSSKLQQMGIGGMIYGFSEIIGWTALKLARFSAGQPMMKMISQGGS